jgi:hypothetical protein
MGAPEHTGRFGADRGRARRSRRGDVRAGVLLLLESEPRNGYQIIRLLEERSQGVRVQDRSIQCSANSKMKL